MSVDHQHDVTIVWRDGETLRRRAGYTHFSNLRPCDPLSPSFPEPDPAPVEFIDLASFD